MADHACLIDDEFNTGLETIKLADLIDTPAFQDLMNSFSALTGMPTAILDIDGNILIKSGWQKICTEYHRKNSISASRCLESDTVLAANLNQGHNFNIYKCKNGLIDVATPIIIDGLHLGNLFAGQFLFEKPDIVFFTQQAERLGFNQKSYLEALKNVPVISDNQIKKIVTFLTDLTQIIARAGIDRKKLLILNHNLKQQVHERTQYLEAEKKFSESLISSLPGVMYVFDHYGQFIGWNRNFEMITGYSKKDILGMTPLNFIAVEDRSKVEATIDEVFKTGQGSVEAKFLTISGEAIPYFFTGYQFKRENLDFLIGVGLDISERVRTEKEKEELIIKLQKSLSQIKKLSGLLPICSSCKKIRDDQGYWNLLESYIEENTDAEFSHSLCPECGEKFYGKEEWYIKMKKKKNIE